jgi:hypothetical protein
MARSLVCAMHVTLMQINTEAAGRVRHTPGVS